MKCQALTIDGAYLVVPEPLSDERGLFARLFCAATFEELGLENNIRQCSTSFNRHKHTLRGMHHQATPHEETKIVRCTRGAAFHAIVDLRPNSPSYRQWASAELNSDNRHMLYVPKGVAHGFLTLADATEIFYQMSTDYAPDSASGVRWDDPAFGVTWPATPAVISERDAAYADYPDRAKD